MLSKGNISQHTDFSRMESILSNKKTIQIANCPNVNENHGTINNEVDFTINAFDMFDEGQYFITSCYY